MVALTTPSNINDTTMLPVMLTEIRHRGFDFAGSFFDGDKWYCSDHNCKLLFWMGMVPSIGQRKDAVNRGKSRRREAVGMFSDGEYRKRAPIEGIFWPRRPSGTSCTAGSSGKTTGAGSPREGRSLGTSGSSTGSSAPTG